jgi:hypothetical protein
LLEHFVALLQCAQHRSVGRIVNDIVQFVGIIRQFVQTLHVKIVPRRRTIGEWHFRPSALDVRNKKVFPPIIGIVHIKVDHVTTLHAGRGGQARRSRVRLRQIHLEGQLVSQRAAMRHRHALVVDDQRNANALLEQEPLADQPVFAL